LGTVGLHFLNESTEHQGGDELQGENRNGSVNVFGTGAQQEVKPRGLRSQHGQLLENGDGKEERRVGVEREGKIGNYLFAQNGTAQKKSLGPIIENHGLPVLS